MSRNLIAQTRGRVPFLHELAHGVSPNFVATAGTIAAALTFAWLYLHAFYG